MRKYRGLTKEGKRIYGWYAKVEEKHCIITDKCRFDCEDDAYGESYGVFFKGIVEVIPETVGQSTGRKDKNDKEIYEGDIIHGENNWGEFGPQEIIWNDDYSTYIVPCTYKKYIKRPLENYQNFLYQLENIEVIGNIHQKPELMEQDNG